MRKKTMDALYQALNDGLTVRDVRKGGVASYMSLQRFEAATGLKFPRAKRGAPIKTTNDRAPAMEAMYRSGYTLEQIGQYFGITRERVRQILRKYTTTTARDGGMAKKVSARRAGREADRDARYFRKYGCSFAQMQEVRAIGRDMMQRGASREKTPVGAYNSQRQNASRRDIEWRMSFWQWWSVWQQSGKWEDRGRGSGYVMCRFGDKGPYEVGNVFIAPAVENSSIQKRKKSGLPIGVTRYRNKYRAQRMIGGQKYWLGTFETPDQAYAAYVAAGEKKAA